MEPGSILSLKPSGWRIQLCSPSTNHSSCSQPSPLQMLITTSWRPRGDTAGAQEASHALVVIPEGLHDRTISQAWKTFLLSLEMPHPRPYVLEAGELNGKNLWTWKPDRPGQRAKIGLD